MFSTFALSQQQFIRVAAAGAFVVSLPHIPFMLDSVPQTLCFIPASLCLFRCRRRFYLFASGPLTISVVAISFSRIIKPTTVDYVTDSHESLSQLSSPPLSSSSVATFGSSTAQART